MPIRFLAVLVAWLLAAGVALAQAGAVEVEDAWARATPGRAETGAVYLTIRAPAGDRLVGASTSIAAKAEVHKTEMSGMVMKMRAMPALEIPAGKPVTLQPGGLHIMLEGLKAPLREGQSFPLELNFAKAGQRQVTVVVEKPGAMGPKH